MQSDVLIENRGSIVVLTPMTESGRDWFATNRIGEPWQWQGASLRVDTRYADDIIGDLESDDMVVGHL